MGIRLTEVLERQRPVLDEIFGRGAYELDDGDSEFCTIRAPNAEVAMVYDSHERWVTCLVKPLLVPEEIRESCPIDDWMRFRGHDAPDRPQGELDDRQVLAELALLRRVMTETFADPEVARDAACFVLGYNAAYADWYGPPANGSHLETVEG